MDTSVNFLAGGETQVYEYFAKISAGGQVSQMESSPTTQKVPPLRLEAPVQSEDSVFSEEKIWEGISPPTDSQNLEVDVYNRE